jgi:hypothetical protein
VRGVVPEELAGGDRLTGEVVDPVAGRLDLAGGEDAGDQVVDATGESGQRPPSTSMNSPRSSSSSGRSTHGTDAAP